MPSRHSRSVLHRAAAAALSGLLLTGIIAPGAALAGPGTPPTPVNDVITTDEGVPATGNVLTNDINDGEGSLSVVGFVAIPGTVGTLSIAANGAYTFTPATGFTGSTTTTYDVANAKHTRPGTITINVNDVPHAPVANDDDVSVVEDTAENLTSEVLGNDTDEDGDSLTVTGADNATNGDVDVTAGVLTFTPDGNVCGDDAASFDYTISDGNGGSDTASVSVDISCQNDGPVAQDDEVAGTEDQNVGITAADLATNDDDTENDALTVTGVSNPSNGTVSLDSGTITFTPDADECGDDVAGFDYTVSDGNGGSDTGSVLISLACVQDAPVADDDTVSVDEDTATDLTEDLLANDDDVDGDELSITGFDNVVGGTVELSEGVLEFTPDADVCGDGAGSFDYTVSDGTDTDTASVTVDVDCENDNPVAVDDDASGTEDANVVIDAATLVANDTDADHDTLTVSAVDNAQGGTVSLDAGTVTFIPDADLCGDDAASFDYTVSDGNGGSDTGTVTIDLTCENDAPVAVDDDASGTEDTAVVIDAAGLATNDTDTEDDTLTVSAVSNPQGGTVALDAGEITFTPDADLCGDDAASFDYTVEDGNGGSDTGTVTIDLACENDAPVAVDDDASGTEDANVVIDAADLAANDTDTEDDTLTVSAVSNPQGGTVALDAGEVTFTPTADLCGDDAASFDYTVEDGNGGSDTGTVTIDLGCVNDAPVAVDDAATVDEDSAAADHDVLANDTDTEDDTLTLESVDVDPLEGTASIVANQVRFTPAADFSGTATVTYVVTDGELDDEGDLVITVTPVADPGDETPPVVGGFTFALGNGRIDQSAPLRISWSATDGESGVTGYEVQLSVNGGSFTPLYAGAATTTVAQVPFNRPLVVRVRATDGEGNTSDWSVSATRRVAAFQNTNQKVEYNGRWRQVGEPRSAGAGHAYTTVKGASVRLEFRGSEVLYVAPKLANGGKVDVFIDGDNVGRFNLQSDTAKFGRIIARDAFGANGRHRIRIVAVKADLRTFFDTFIVLK